MDDQEYNDRLQELTRKHREAVFRESFIRETSFLPITLHICGLPVTQFTPYQYILLDCVGNPYTSGKYKPNAGQIADFLWVISTEYKDNDSAGKNKYITEKLADLIYDDCDKQIQEYLSNSFIDMPPQQAERKTQQVPQYAWIESYIDQIASEYGWTDEYIIRLPFTRIFQHMKAINTRHAYKAGVTPPQYNNLSDGIKKDIIKLNLQRVSDDNAKKKE